MPTASSNVRVWGQSGKHMLVLSSSQFDPGRVETFFVPQKLHATGRDGPRRDRLSVFLLYRVWSQSGRATSSHADDLNGHTARTT
jgi:hypothetical protein